MKLSHMGFFIRLCLLASVWLSAGFLLKYTLVSIRMCNYAVSNAVAVVTVSAACFLSLIILVPKQISSFKYALYELLAICSAANGLSAYFGPGTCIPNLPRMLKFCHALCAFSFAMTLALLMLAPTSDLGILRYEDKEEKEEESQDVEREKTKK